MSAAGKPLGPFLHFEKTLSDLYQNEPSGFRWLEVTLGKTAVSRTLVVLLVQMKIMHFTQYLEFYLKVDEAKAKTCL